MRTIKFSGKGTTNALIGKKVRLLREGREIIATIRGLNSLYPKTAYNVSWMRSDNPLESFDPDTEGYDSIVHFSQVQGAA